MPPLRPLTGGAVVTPPRTSTDVGSTPATPSENRLTPFSTSFTPVAGSSGETRLAKVRQLLQGHTDRSEEKQILSLFREATPKELNQMLSGLSLHELHELVDDMDDRWLGPDNRKAFLKVLSQERLPDLTIEGRAKVIHALQHHQTDRGDEAAIRDVFLGTKGPALTALKNTLDNGGDYRDLQQLVFHDLDDKAVRSAVLSHFAKEGAASTSQVKVFSDIDDTFYANLKDHRFPMKTVYPGVRALYQELDKGGSATADRPGDLLFLSARPYDRPGLGESHTRNMLDDNNVRPATVLSGDFAHIVGNDAIASKKYDNWSQLRQLYPEYGSVFLGDSGQGDAIFGAKAAATQGGEMKRVFIHNVTGLNDAQKADFAQKGVFVFDTYVGAAIEAFKSGLITKEGLERVATTAQRELDAVQFSDPAQKAARQAELDRDLQSMRALP
jgi:hypothetical protein